MRVQLYAAILMAIAGSAGAAPSDQTPGQKIHIDLKALPEPYSPPSRANPPRTVPRPAGALPTVPAGFVAEPLRSAFPTPFPMVEPLR